MFSVFSSDSRGFNRSCQRRQIAPWLCLAGLHCSGSYVILKQKPWCAEGECLDPIPVVIHISMWPEFMWLSVNNVLLPSPKIKELKRILKASMITLEINTSWNW